MDRTAAPSQWASALIQLDAAAAENRLSAAAAKNVRAWLTESRYAPYAPLVAEHIAQGKWKELDDAFWTVIPFGTGGRRGRMYPIGCNTINDRTIGESAQGLADYVRQVQTGPFRAAVAYDTRHRSRHFAELCSEVFVAAGFEVFFLDGFRSTPELSYCVRHFGCSCAIMVTASHNPPADNAVKAYWNSGAQLLPPHDAGVIDRVMQVQEIQRTPFADALAKGQIKLCQEEVDPLFQAAVLTQRHSGARKLKLVYSPLHGVGASAILPVLAADGFAEVELFAPHAAPDGDFPNVPGHVSNPENPAVFDSIAARAEAIGADLAIASDPDCDRIGLAAPLEPQAGSPWRTLSGNQIGALLAEFLLDRRRAAGTLGPKHYLVTTLVTSKLVCRIAEAYGVSVCRDLQVGFKWIAQTMDALGPDLFVFGTEESHGYLAGSYARDKDGVVAAMLAAEMAAWCKSAGLSIHQKLDALFWQYGCHLEKQVSVALPGSLGMAEMQALMARFRTAPPPELAGLGVTLVRDYLGMMEHEPGGALRAFDGPTGDMVMLELATAGTYVAVRPSGTEPKVKFYLFAYEPPEQIANLEATKTQLSARLDQLARDLTGFAFAKPMA